MSNCEYNTCFKDINNISDDLLLNILESNFKTFFDWSFLKIGAWFDAKIINSSTIYGGSTPMSQLLLVDDPSFTSGKVWQGIRKDWVWENPVSFGSENPISISGVYINNSFVPQSSGTFLINYPEGRIIFDNSISKNSNVKINYSYRYVQVYRASDSPWFNILQYPSMDNSLKDIQQKNNGEWSIAGNHRIQLPAIVIDPVPRSRSRPYEIGNTSLWIEQDIAFYILAENKNDRNKLLDIIRLQQDLTIQLYDTNALTQDEAYPLDHNGDLKNNALMYPDMVQNYPWKKCFIKNISLFDMESTTPNLHQGVARATVEIIST
jgi:hypothetical protein